VEIEQLERSKVACLLAVWQKFYKFQWQAANGSSGGKTSRNNEKESLHAVT